MGYQLSFVPALRVDHDTFDEVKDKHVNGDYYAEDVEEMSVEFESACHELRLVDVVV
jgi:hypothetical protein